MPVADDIQKPAAAWTPPPSAWEVQAKDIMCVRQLLAAMDREPSRIGLATVLTIIEGTTGYSAASIEMLLRDGRSFTTTHAIYMIAPEHRVIARQRKLEG
jgi:hypothetical protein